MTEYTKIRFEKQDAVAIITLNDTKALNAITYEMADEICHALEHKVEKDKSVRALILTGSGRSFCAGQNLKGSALESTNLAQDAIERYLPVFQNIRSAPVPVICAINGIAAGGGCSLALVGDIIIAAKSATFIQIFSKIGLVPDTGSSYFLPKLIGRARALKVMMTNEPIKAEQALNWGMISEVVDDEALMPTALELAKRLSEGPTRSLTATRDLVDASESNSFDAQFIKELEVQEEILKSHDAQEGIKAFIEKRAAKFSGN